MHHLTASVLSLLACGIVADAVLADTDHIYLEEGGIVLLEAEDGSADAGWLLQTEIAGYKGSGYLVWTGPDSFSKSAAGKGNIAYHFRIETAGNYQLLLRSRITSGESNTEANDTWVRLSTGTDVPEEEALNGWTKLYTNVLGDWTWSSKTVDHVGRPLRQSFTQGDHTVEISGRSVGHAVDRIALYQYEDVAYNSKLANSWELSKVLTGDGTIVDPNGVTEPLDPEVSEPVDPEIPEEAALQNLLLVEAAGTATLNNECSGNTLALPASSNRLVDPADSVSTYTSGEYLTISPGASSVLMKFDLSLVPPFTSALLEYSTGTETSNGTVSYALGSHSLWPSSIDEDVPQPHTSVVMSQSSGGWMADSRYQAELPATLLSSEVLTLILSSDVPSEPMSIFGYVETERAPRLLLTGNEDFCANWRSNVDNHNAPVEPPPELHEILTPVPEISPEEETPDTKTEPLGGGFMSWLSLIMLSAGLFVRQLGGDLSKPATRPSRALPDGRSDNRNG